MRLRVVSVPEDDQQDGLVQFADGYGYVNDDFKQGIVVMTGNPGAPDYTIVFTNGDSHFYDSEGPFTPRVEDWADTNVKVLLDMEV